MRFVVALILVLGCSGSPAPRPNVDPRTEGPPPELPREPAPKPEVLPPPPDPVDTVPTPARPTEPIAPYALAWSRGWMPLAPTGVPGFLAEHPTWDGRGVIIGILDGGVDVGVAGFDSTPSGARKVLDLRDFSREGRVPLAPIEPRGDSVRIGDRSLAGFARIRALDTNGPWYGGLLNERPLGESPASDINGDGRDDGSFPLVVVGASDGWVVFADTDGDGSLADERGVRDYLGGRETIGWRTAGRRSPLAVAVNLSTTAGVPTLDLFFDTGGHGTHVAGIAAAHGIGAVQGFNGVAPGAHLLGLKIARNDFGGITTTGSVVRAMDYAIRFARGRQLSLVLNMSYGVGNEREGTARIDALIDSVLAANPDVLFVTSSGNDGPGLSTVGFPGTARLGLTVGATYPGVFIPPGPGRGAARDVLAFFSSRGGETAKPDLVAPGYAFSTVPRWDLGEEFKGGTSMAAPHAAGLAAILLSAARQEHREVSAADLKRTLIGSARSLAGGGPLDEGAGQPSLPLAWRLLREPAPRGRFEVEVRGRPGQTAALRFRGKSADDSLVSFRVRRQGADAPAMLKLSSSVPWLAAPPRIEVTSEWATVALVERLPRSTRPGPHTAVVEATEDGIEGTRFRLIVTVIVPALPVGGAASVTSRIAPGGVERLFFTADSGRPFRIQVETASPGDSVLAFLHAPGGAPVPGSEGIPAGAASAAGTIAVDGRDAREGIYEAAVAAPPDASVTSRVTAELAPVDPGLAERRGDTIVASFRSRGDSVVAGEALVLLVGAERVSEMGGTGSADVTLPFRLPAWTGRAVLDLTMDAERWPDFTDFGFTLRATDGRILGKQPLNYAFGRLTVELEPTDRDQDVEVVLAPGFAEPRLEVPWRATVSIRLYARSATALPPSSGEAFRLAPGQSAAIRFIKSVSPWPLPGGFAPLARVTARVGETPWTREVRLEP